MTTKFISRIQNVVRVQDTDTLVERDVNLSTPDQAELYEQLLLNKVYSRNVDFAKNLVVVRNPSTNANGQLYWIRKIVDDTNAYHARQQTPALSSFSAATTLDISKILEMFANARQHLKRPKITLMIGLGPNQTILPDTRKIRFSLDSNRGRLYMNGEVYGTTYGWFDTTSFKLTLKHYGYKYEKQLMQLLEAFAKEPQKTAIIHGKLTGNCCFCSLPLSDSRSLQMGYGPVCADHWHLPWGDKGIVSAEVDWVAGDKPKMVA